MHQTSLAHSAAPCLWPFAAIPSAAGGVDHSMPAPNVTAVQKEPYARKAFRNLGHLLLLTQTLAVKVHSSRSGGYRAETLFACGDCRIRDVIRSLGSQ